MSHTEGGPDPGADYGEVFTRRWIVDLILDVMGYTPDEDLGAQVVVEPSCGTGAFLVPIVERLIESSNRHGRNLGSLEYALRGFDLLEANAERARKAVAPRLHEAGLPQQEADDLTRNWVTTGDFLLQDLPAGSADFVVGNPPYVRLESVSAPVMNTYRRLCPTMRGRSDIYVGFIERGLKLLQTGGLLAYICADRWMRNQYGTDLRKLISDSFSVETVVTMHDVDAFEDDVSAYPAIIVIRNKLQGEATVVDARRGFGEPDAAKVTNWIRSPRATMSTPRFQASRLTSWFDGQEFWPSASPTQLALLTELETRFPPLEHSMTGTRVGIGVATGCDDVYITTDDDLVEDEPSPSCAQRTRRQVSALSRMPVSVYPEVRNRVAAAEAPTD